MSMLDCLTAAARQATGRRHLTAGEHAVLQRAAADPSTGPLLLTYLAGCAA